MITKQQAVTYSQILGVYQFLGALVGIIINFYAAYTTFFFNLFFILYTLIALGLLAFSLYASYKCLQNPLFGLTLSLYNQIVQFVWFTFFGFTYRYNVGLGFYVGFDLSTGIDFNYKLSWPAFGFGKSPSDRMIIMINIIPIVLALFIDPIKKAIKLKPTD